jgi:16S rRNA (cytosine1402-N4)-methyltransferase
MTGDGLQHRPVLLQEVLDYLRVPSTGRYVDGTFGRGGHSRAILERLGSVGRLLVIDKDPEAVAAAQEQLGADRRVMIRQGSIAELERLVQDWGWCGAVDGVLFDLGVSSPQLDDACRGFSFSANGPLDMRMDPGRGISAAAWLQRASSEQIATVLREFGEERFARRIARGIVRARQGSPILTTRRLADIVARASPSWQAGKHPATRTFQALRIFINQELAELERGLEQAVRVLAPGGRLAVISFHSLEHRIVKRFLAAQVRGGEVPHRLPVTHQHFHPRLRMLCRSLGPKTSEVEANPRARSAVLRVAERVQ